MTQRTKSLSAAVTTRTGGRRTPDRVEKMKSTARRLDHYAAIERATEALAAADIYVTRLVSALQEISLELRDGGSQRASEDLAGAIAGIRCLADILAAVGRATGLDTLPSTDQELGHIALCLREIADHEKRKATGALASVIDDDLIPALTRLAPTFPQLEARVASLV